MTLADNFWADNCWAALGLSQLGHLARFQGPLSGACVRARHACMAAGCVHVCMPYQRACRRADVEACSQVLCAVIRSSIICICLFLLLCVHVRVRADSVCARVQGSTLSFPHQPYNTISQRFPQLSDEGRDLLQVCSLLVCSLLSDRNASTSPNCAAACTRAHFRNPPLGPSSPFDNPRALSCPHPRALSCPHPRRA